MDSMGGGENAMIVVCAGMFRSGSTWQYQVACELLSRYGRPVQRLGFLEGAPLAEFLAGPVDPGIWYVYKTHPPDPIHRLLQPASVRTFYSYRDLRDVVYSMAHKLGGLSFWEVAQDRRFLAQCIEADAFWRAMPNVSGQRYEDWVEDLTPFVRQIADALEVELPDAALAEVANEFSLSRNRERSAAVATRLAEEGVDLSDRANAFLHDPETLLHWNHFRGGRVGGWRELATPDEKAYLAVSCGEWLVARGYERDHTWASEVTGNAPGTHPLPCEKWVQPMRGHSTLPIAPASHGPDLANTPP
jgi:hypothetical protein